MGDFHDAIFNNPLILGNILPYLENVKLLRFRAVSKFFDEECVRILTKRRYGRWVHGELYFKKVQELLKGSRHPNLLMGKVLINGDYVDPESQKEFLEVVPLYTDHITSLWLHFYPNGKGISVLNVCSNIVDLRIMGVMRFGRHDPVVESDLISKCSFSFRQLSILYFKTYHYGEENISNFYTDVLKKVLKASDGLTMLGIQSSRFSDILKPILEDSELTEKFARLKTLHVDDADLLSFFRDNPLRKENDLQLLNLLFSVRNSIENLYFTNSSWKGLQTDFWPIMPNLTTLSFDDQDVFDISIKNIPRRSHAPKLNLIMVGNHYWISQEGWSSCKWEIELDGARGMQYFKDYRYIQQEHKGAFAVDLWSMKESYLEDGLRFLKDVEAEVLYLNMFNGCDKEVDVFSKKCWQQIPSLDRIFVRTLNRYRGVQRVRVKTLYPGRRRVKIE